MTLCEKIMHIYPALTIADLDTITGTIHLQNDGNGDYIKEWANSNPRPSLEQLAALDGKV
ncbi:Bacteriophage SP-beta, YorD [uncultured Caudovirales phage]|uniref:Bacteriophage SP-beta, YorD n=1 Tax=uncultured Caudovirales phage TaxID=2100421 RepID=A0A6J5QNV7_9CAUD|nr:Bacteriophage SP-beta, YorD [uncultured Caudovirales phage]CAB4215900.1 Bacteriophage SP-beta, YorD [uncultured Caudovirales phage]CAB5230117.1 Bacteriophage SP-beta, YorD [uncultured Caudovirales phage]